MNEMTAHNVYRDRVIVHAESTATSRAGAPASGHEVECVLNPGVFRYAGAIWMLVRVAERPQLPGKISFPVLVDGRWRCGVLIE